MNNLIRNVIYCIFPEYRGLEIIGVCTCAPDYEYSRSGLEELAKRRLQGNRCPAVIFGFDSLEKVKQLKDGDVLDASGVFYLKLPALLSSVRTILQEAISCEMPAHSNIDEAIARRHAIEQVSSFNHRCNNIWQAMMTRINLSRKAIKEDPQTFPLAVIEETAGKYDEIRPLIKKLGIEDAEKVPQLFDEAITIIARISNHHENPENVVDLAFECSEKIRSIVSILSCVKELKTGD